MNERKKGISGLSPAKRAFLEQRLLGKMNSLGNRTVSSQKPREEMAPLAFRSDGDGTPLFLFHYLTPSQTLAKHLGSGRPVYGVDSAFEEELDLWEETGEMKVSVEELAARCLVELQQAQPKGPYFLAGFCFGGVLAFEAANRLRKQGEEVAFLGLLDSFYLPAVDLRFLPWLRANSENSRISEKSEAEREQLRRLAFMREVIKTYRGEPYSGRAVLFRAIANRDSRALGTHGWNEVLLDGVQVEDFQCTRGELFENPFVVELGARLAQQLSRADAPLCKNGAVARDLPRPPELAQAPLEKLFIGPTTFVEKTLVEIWSKVLRIEKIGVQDRFFELGGDSILGIQVVAQANKAGLRLTLKQIFQHQTIAELALVADAVTHPSFEQDLISGDVPLAPIQEWFFGQNFADQHHWNQARLLELQRNLEPQLLETAIQHLVAHHDALRLRFRRGDSGWEQFYAGSEEAVKLALIDFTRMPNAQQASAMECVAAELQGSLNLSQGPLVRATLFDLGERRPRLLLVVIHHLAVDGVSWRILLADLETICQQLQNGEMVKPPAKTTSFKAWAQQLTEYAHSSAFAQEADYWLGVSSAEIGPIPLDLSGGQNTEASVGTVSVALDAEETRSLLQQVPQAYNTQINDVLLSALGLALTSWMGKPSVRINLEGHGREELFEGIDLSRTVGWFTTIFPVVLDLPAGGEPGEALKSVKERLRRIPERGIGYGILRYLSGDEDVAARLRAFPQPEVIFNYLGQFDQTPSIASAFVSVKESIGPVHSPQARRHHLLEINSSVADGQLRLDWRYSEAVHRRTTIERLARTFLEALRSLIYHCTSSGAGGYTPSDFPEADLNQQDLDQLLVKLNECED